MSTLLSNFGLLLDWLSTLTDAMKTIIVPVLVIATTAGIIYAVVVGIKFVKAEDKGQRDEAKQKLITVIVGVVVTLVLIGLFYWLSSKIGDWVGSEGDLSKWIT